MTEQPSSLDSKFSGLFPHCDIEIFSLFIHQIFIQCPVIYSMTINVLSARKRTRNKKENILPQLAHIPAG